VSEAKVPGCPECGVALPGESPATVGVSKELAAGKIIPGTEKFHGIFHPECRPRYKKPWPSRTEPQRCGARVVSATAGDD
jgi:hypothetical protein